MKPNAFFSHLKEKMIPVKVFAKKLWRGIKISWQKAGFYISLAGCLILIGAAAYQIRSRPPVVPENRPMATVQPAGAQSDFVETLDQAKLDLANEEIAYLWPVDGREILTAHDPNTPIWSSTLFQWQPHTGLDIKAPLGEAVRAVADGTVLRAYKDPLLGNIVELSHVDGLVTRYASLMTLDAASVGTQITAGQVIGAVGASAASESALGAHLHFEAYRDGEWADVLMP